MLIFVSFVQTFVLLLFIFLNKNVLETSHVARIVSENVKTVCLSVCV